MRTEQHRLQPGDRCVARREVRDRFQPDHALDRRRGDETAHPSARTWVVVDVDDVHVARLLQRSRELEHRVRVAASRRVDLDGDDELACAELPLQECLALGLARRDDDLPLANDEPRARAAILVDGVPDRRDLGRRRSAAAADDPRAELARVRSELGEVVRRRVREDHALAGEAREADVRERGQRFAALAHPLDGTKRRLEAGAVVRADRGDVERCERCGRLLGGDAPERLRVLVEGQERDDRQR